MTQSAPSAAPSPSLRPTSSDPCPGPEPAHPWCGIDLDVYEQHMSDDAVGQLQLLHTITADQLTAHPTRTLAILGIAGGNGLDLVDPADVDAVHGYDVNPDYLAACRARHHDRLRGRLRLVHAAVGATLRIEPVGLLIANLVVEYIGLEQFAAFAALNADRIGVLSTVVQHDDDAGFVSPSGHAAAFAALAPVSSDVHAADLAAALGRAGFTPVGKREHSLPNGKTLVRQDFRPIQP